MFCVYIYLLKLRHTHTPTVIHCLPPSYTHCHRHSLPATISVGWANTDGMHVDNWCSVWITLVDNTRRHYCGTLMAPEWYHSGVIMVLILCGPCAITRYCRQPEQRSVYQEIRYYSGWCNLCNSSLGKSSLHGQVWMRLQSKWVKSTWSTSPISN